MCQVVCHTLVSQTPNFLTLLGDHLLSVLDLLGHIFIKYVTIQ